MLHDEKHLVPWRSNADLLVDRFDVRNFMDNAADLVKYRRFSNQHGLIDQSDPKLSPDQLGN